MVLAWLAVAPYLFHRLQGGARGRSGLVRQAPPGSARTGGSHRVLEPRTTKPSTREGFLVWAPETTKWALGRGCRDQEAIKLVYVAFLRELIGTPRLQPGNVSPNGECDGVAPPLVRDRHRAYRARAAGRSAAPVSGWRCAPRCCCWRPLAGRTGHCHRAGIGASKWPAGAGAMRRSGWRASSDLPRGAPPAKVDAARLVELTTQSQPARRDALETRTMAAVLGVSAATVSRHWRKHGLKPHRWRPSRCPATRSSSRSWRTCRLYLNPPEHALVLCCDEKSQVQALDRTQRGCVEEGPGGDPDPRLQAHGTTTLFAALTARPPGHRAMPATAPPQRVAEVPAPDRPRHASGQDAALIADNYATTSTPPCRSGRQAPALPQALHAHLGVLAEHGRAVLP